MQIDAVAKSRDGKFRIVSNDEREQTLNQLLTVRYLLTVSLLPEPSEFQDMLHVFKSVL